MDLKALMFTKICATKITAQKKKKKYVTTNQ